MIPLTDIKAIFADASPLLTAIKTSYPDFKLIRANQPGEAPAPPYGTWLIITDANESAHQNIRTQAVNESDDTLIDVTRYEKTSIKISMTFIDKNKIERAQDISRIAMEWFRSTAGKEFCRTNDLVPIFINVAVQDRTVLNDDLSWECRWGFDLRFDTSATLTEQIETVDSIEMTSSVNNDDALEEVHEVDLSGDE